MPVCEIDLRPGGRWRYVWRKASGSEMTMTGAVQGGRAPGAAGDDGVVGARVARDA